MSTLGSSALVPALAASLVTLEAQQEKLIAQLRDIHSRLSQGNGNEDELVPTLTYYINQANSIQRRMMLIHGRVSDLKRRLERLKEHRAKQGQQVAEWMAQEQSKQIPEAVVALAPKSNMLFSPSVNAEQSQGMSSSLPASPFLDKVKATMTRSARSSPPPACESGSLANAGAAGEPGSSSNGSDPLGISSNGLSIPIKSASPTPSIASTMDSVARPKEPVQIATVKRKGKRRVRVPTIE
ncbi:hypothetical protein GGI25_005105 [Coemansia spiralis]|uniref:Uncharacterized protein n=2 Tax=Coemansia TaxID=4863 RepID=A0A9W8KWJ4_9FUNG|nr:hypothetical protein BX070DRAFT_84269 [Coemansia spiralis]KAJ1988917.1 hypothetical protein EDC05_005012 [Coemansia umbellata]KAJ2620018.1 hypothetical protein GGI26_005367 [Coemansia sp. RSA 1358]KAJ2672502.1 hypothetical protein GGI25_005105 [Coemansia spiralis]